MSQCERCGATNEATSRFCVSCGSPLIQSSSPAPPAADLRASANLPFAETAAPPTREEYERYQAEVRASLAQPVASPGSPSGAHHHSSSPPRPGPTAQPPAPMAPTAMPHATAAVQGLGQDPDEVPVDAPRILCGFVVSYEPEALGRYWPLHQGRNVVGRDGAAQGLDIPIAHPTTSSRHAVFYGAARPGRLKVEDSGSTNGTFVNDVRLPAGQRVELRDGDRIRFGLFSALVKII